MTVNPAGSASVQAPLPSVITPTKPTAAADPTADVQKAALARRVGASAAQQPQNDVEQPGKPVDPQELERALQEVRKVVEPVARNLQFSIDSDTGRTLVKVVDSTTKEVIRQIPSEEILSIAKALDKLQGLLIKQEA